MLMFGFFVKGHGFFVSFCPELKAGGLSHAEGAIEGTNSMQSLRGGAGEPYECSQMEKIGGSILA